MKKGTVAGIVAVVVILLAGFGIGLPYYTGLQTEKQIRPAIEAILQDTPITLKDFQYERGLFSARGASSLELTAGKDTLVIPVEHAVRHGVCPMTLNLVKVVSTVRLPDTAPAEFKHFFKDQSPLTITSVVSTNKSMHSEFASPSFEGHLPGDDPLEIHWKGFSGTVTLSPDWNRAAVAFLAPSLAVHEEKARLTIETLRINADMHRGSAEGIWLGMSRAEMKRLSFEEKHEQGAADEAAHADDFSLSAEIHEKDGALAVTYNLGFAKLKAGSQDFAKAALEIKLLNLDSQVFMTLRSRLRDLSQQEADESTRSRETLKTVLDLLPKFVARSPEVAVSRLEVASGEGQVRGEGRLKYVGGPGIERFQPLRDLEGEARLAAPQSLVQSLGVSIVGIGGKDLDAALGPKAEAMKQQLIRERLDDLIEDGVIVEQGSDYSSHILLKDGRLILNGKPLDLPPGS